MRVFKNTKLEHAFVIDKKISSFARAIVRRFSLALLVWIWGVNMPVSTVHCSLSLGNPVYISGVIIILILIFDSF